MRQPRLGRQRHLELQPPLGEPPVQLVELDVDDPHQLIGVKPVENQHIVEAVDELRLERGAHRRHHLLLTAARPEVGRQDEDRVAEVHRAALPIREPALVEHLQQDVEHIRVGLFHLVEEHHRVGTPAHRLGQLTTLVITDVAGRSTHHAGHRVLLAILAHVDADHRPLIVEQEVGQCLGQLGLTDTGGAEEQKRSGRPVGVGDSRPSATHRVRDGLHGPLLPDDALAQLVFHPQQLGGLALQQPAGRDARPCRHHIGDVVGTDLFLEHHVGPGVSRRQRCVEFLFHLRDAAVTQLGGLGQVAVALGTLGLAAQRVELFLEFADNVDGVLLVVPARGQLGELLFVVGQFCAQLLQALLGCRVFFFGQRHLFDLESAHHPFDFVDLDGPRVDFHP